MISFPEFELGSPVSFVIPGNPIPKGRVRGRNAGKFIQFYNPKSTVTYENTVAKCAYRAMKGREIITGPCVATVIGYYQIPKSRTKAMKGHMRAGRILCLNRKDTDNHVKSVFDGMNKVVYTDDHQVVRHIAEKHWSDDPRTLVMVQPLIGKYDV